MRYFDDLQFVAANEPYDCDAVVDGGLPGFCAVNFLNAGAIWFGQDGQAQQRLEAPAFYWTWPEPHWRYWSTGEAPWIHSWVSFRGPRTRRLREGLLLPELPYPAVQLSQHQPMADLFDRLARLVVRRDPRDHGECVLLLERLLWLAQRERERDPRGADGDSLGAQLETLAERLRAEPFRDWHFPHEATAMGVSYSHFRSRFREQLQDSPQAYLQRCRMLQMARELEQSDSVKSVAYAHGYRDLGNFSRAFRRVFGISPREYQAGMPRRPA